MGTPRTYSRVKAQKSTIEGLFAIVLQEHPQEAASLLVRLQQKLRERAGKGSNVG